MARTRGSQDRQPRRSRLASAAMVGAGGVGLAGAGYGARVGLGVLGAKRRRKKMFAQPGMVRPGMSRSNRQIATDIMKGDRDYLRAAPGRFTNEVKSGFATTRRRARSAFGRVKGEVTGGFQGTRRRAKGAYTMAATDVRAAGSALKGRNARAFLKTGTGKVAGGLAAGGAAYGIYRAVRARGQENRRRNRPLMNRMGLRG